MAEEDKRGERLASLESEVRFVKEMVMGISQKLDNFQQHYITRVDADEKLN
ncbi:TPA: hypothetical protein REU56_002928, partial [Listeria monocytogenes]|nr:hypothetical protein [Listeria monocytogenes]